MASRGSKRSTSSRSDPPDIERGMAMKAKKLRFDHVPDADVRYTGDSRSATERKNLPEEVEPGVTYRDSEALRRGEWTTRVGNTRGRKEP